MIKKIYEMTSQEITDFINNLLPVKKIEKDTFGEVFTNPVLINKLLDLFPSIIWNDPFKKWLDPCTGSGFFMIFVYLRLMESLENWQPNSKKRSFHIIKNMLFMVELNKNNCKICNNLFGTNINLICNDFLEDSFNDLTFDCIVGNPPFQDFYGLNNNGKRILGGKNKLYERIFLKSYNLLNKNGYLSFIVPDNIFSGNGSECYKTLIQNSIPFISFNPINQSFFPGIQQYICYFIMNKTNNLKNTTIDNGLNNFNIKLENRPVNPIRNWTLETEKLVKKYVSLQRNNSIYNRGKRLDSYSGNKYPIVYSNDKIIHTNNKNLAVGLGIKKAIIFSISVNLDFKMDYTGNFGIGPNTFYIPFNRISQGKKLEKFLNSNDYKTLVLATKTTRQFLKIALIEHLNLSKIMNSNYKFKSKKIIAKTNKSKTRKL